jgi:hypothetical protein
MGLFYGEQERLDLRNNGPLRPIPMNPNPGAAPWVNPVPGNAPAMANPGNPVDTPPAYGNVDRFGYGPPPGTLGQTYKRRTRLIDDAKHPRIGIVEVNLPEHVDVTAKGLKTKWDGKVWRLESDPLIPGVPHIYEVKASWGEGTEPQVRTVRLIMGRIVDVEFDQ